MEAPTVNLPLGGQETIPATIESIPANKIMPPSRLNGAAGLTGSDPLASQEPPVIVREQDSLNLLNPNTALRDRPQVGPEDQIMCWVIEQESLATPELKELARFVYFYIEQARLGGTSEWHALVDRLDSDPWLTSLVAQRLLRLDRDRLKNTDIAHLIGDEKKDSSIRKYRDTQSPEEVDKTPQQEQTPEKAPETSAPQDPAPEVDPQPESAPYSEYPFADRATQMENYEIARQDFASLDTQWGNLYDLLCEVENLPIPNTTKTAQGWPEIIVSVFAKERTPQETFDRLRDYLRNNYEIEI